MPSTDPPPPRAPRDRTALRIPARPGRPRVDQPRSVAVVGGGIAGLAAATALAERGVEVTVLEATDRLGGRVAAWSLPDGRTMSRGFHAFFRQYHNLRSLLRRADPGLDQLVPIADYPLQRADGAVDSFAALPRVPPWNLAGFVLRSPTFPVRALAEVDVRAALEIIDVDFPASHSRLDGVSASEFLDRLRFPEGARHLALEVFARSFFAHPDDFAAGELLAMFHTYFAGSAEGLLFDVPADDYSTSLWEPLGRHLTGSGVSLRTGTSVTALTQRPGGWQLRGPDLDVDAVVLAADPRSTRSLVAGLEPLSPPRPGTPHPSTRHPAARLPAPPHRHDSASEREVDRWRSQVTSQRNAPPFAVLRLWLAGPIDPTRPAFLGTSGYLLLDNVSVLERFERGARRWSAAQQGSVVELHAYALDAQRDPRVADRGWVRTQLLTDLRAVYPETAHLPIVHEEFRFDDDCGLVDTTAWHQQPGVSTPLPGLVLAGDRIRCDYPVALMERAATTGFLAADELLAGWGVAGPELIAPPMRGVLRRGALGRVRRLVGARRGRR